MKNEEREEQTINVDRESILLLSCKNRNYLKYIYKKKKNEMDVYIIP